MKLVIINGLDSQSEEFGFYQREGEVWATLSDNSFPALLLGKRGNRTEMFKADGKENPVGGNGDLPKTVLVHENINVIDALRPHPANRLTNIYSDSASWIPINPRLLCHRGGRSAQGHRVARFRRPRDISREPQPTGSVCLVAQQLHQGCRGGWYPRYLPNLSYRPGASH